MHKILSRYINSNEGIYYIVYLFLLFSFFNVKAYAQVAYINLGYQHNFIKNAPEFNHLTSFGWSANYGYNFTASVPMYAGLSYTRFFANDQLESTNKYRSSLLGLHAGIRPLAKTLIFQVQPLLEGGFMYEVHADSTKLQPIKYVYNYGAGIELYITKKTCFSVIYLWEHYVFTKQTFINNSARASLKFNF